MLRNGDFPKSIGDISSYSTGTDGVVVMLGLKGGVLTAVN